jgi:hypothetical protein
MFERAHDEVAARAHQRFPQRRPSALVIEYRKDLLLDGHSTDEGWFHPCKRAWKREAIRNLAQATADSIRAHFAEIDPRRYGSNAG